MFISGYLQNRTFLPAAVLATAAPGFSGRPSGKSHGGYNPWEAAAHSDFRAWPILPAVPKTRCELFLQWLAHNRQASTAASTNGRGCTPEAAVAGRLRWPPNSA